MALAPAGPRTPMPWEKLLKLSECKVKVSRTECDAEPTDAIKTHSEVNP
jgi:hypothetical protein